MKSHVNEEANSSMKRRWNNKCFFEFVVSAVPTNKVNNTSVVLFDEDNGGGSFSRIESDFFDTKLTEIFDQFAVLCVWRNVRDVEGA